MPLIIICGYPSSGKTYRAGQLVEHFYKRAGVSLAPEKRRWASRDSTSSAEATPTPHPQPNSAPSTPASNNDKDPRSPRIHYISDATQHVPRSAYGASRAEKDARAALYSAVKRALSKDDVVVLDSGNYIKGWRYQLHCEAKNLGTRCCVVHVGTAVDKAREVNARRIEAAGQGGGTGRVGGEGGEDAYDEGVFEELVMRFEEPNPMARWDSPLFTVVWDDESPPCDRIWEEVVEGVGRDGKAKREVKPNQATMTSPTASSTHLYELDRITQSIIACILQYQKDHSDELGGTARIPSEITGKEVASQPRELQVHLPVASSATSAQLQRLRRQFIALHRQQMGGMGMGGVGPGGGALNNKRIAELFVDYLNDAFEQQR